MNDTNMSTGLTPFGWRLVVVITALSVAHHVDHLLRGVTGWPFGPAFDPFSASLFVYPVISVGAFLSARGRVGPGFWSVLAGGAAVFLLVIHVGPAAGDSISDIAGQYGPAAAGWLAVALLIALVGLLGVHCVYETRRFLRTRARRPR